MKFDSIRPTKFGLMKSKILYLLPCLEIFIYLIIINGLGNWWSYLYYLTSISGPTRRPFNVMVTDGSNNRNRDTTACFSTTAIRLSVSQPQPQFLFLNNRTYFKTFLFIKKIFNNRNRGFLKTCNWSITSHGVAHFSLLYKKNGISEPNMQTLFESIDPKTLSQYSGIWKRFYNWINISENTCEINPLKKPTAEKASTLEWS